MPRSSLKTTKPLRARKPLERKSRLRPVSPKRRARQRRAREEMTLSRVAAAAREAAARVDGALLPVRTVATTRRALAAAQPKAVEFVSLALMERLHQLPCRRCGKPQVTAQHFPPQSVLAVRDDRLVTPYCGDGTSGCHGDGQHHRISNEQQLVDVGATLARLVKEGLVSWPGVEQALRNLGTVDLGWAAIVRGKVIEELAIPGEEWR